MPRPVPTCRVVSKRKQTLTRQRIELSWRKPDDGGADVSGYELEFSLTEEDGSWADVGTSYDHRYATNDDAEHGDYEEAPLSQRQTYYYRVRAIERP